MPNLSIVVCTYNRCDGLRGTLDALIRQQLDADVAPELIVVDNRSTDRTREVVEVLASRAPWPVRSVHEPVQGLCQARNTGIRHARGAWLAFTDDDGEADPRWAMALVRALRDRGADVACGRVRPVWEARAPEWARRFGAGAYAFVDLGEEPLDVRDGLYRLLGVNMAFRREVFERCGMFRLDLGPVGAQPLRGDDTEFFERVVAAGCRVVYEPRALMHHHVTTQRMTKRYLRRWYYWQGYSTARYRAPEEPLGRVVLGMPGWALREATATAVGAAGCYLRGRLVAGFGGELRCRQQIGFARGLVDLARGKTVGAAAEVAA